MPSASENQKLLDVIAGRWSPYGFDARPVEREKLLACLEAASLAPSSYNEQPWTFIVAERTNHVEFERMLECLVEGNQAWAKNAGVLLITVTSRQFARNGNPNRACEHDIGLAAMSFALQATALGLQAHQMIGILPPKIRQAYAIPEAHEPLTAIALGYPGGDDAELLKRDNARRGRKPIREIVFTGRWGERLD